MCQELEPERVELPPEAWDASNDAQAQQQRARSDSDSSTTSTRPSFNVPKWTWPESKPSQLPPTGIYETITPILER